MALRYLDNPNGSQRNIAGILSEGRNVLGMMPHPERAADPLVGGTDGLTILTSLVSAYASQVRPFLRHIDEHDHSRRDRGTPAHRI